MKIRCTPGRSLLFLSIFIVTGLAYPSAVRPQDQGLTHVKRVINRKGWEIPGLLQSRAVSSRQILKGFGNGSSDMYVTVLKPDSEVIAPIPSYSSQDNGETIFVGQRQAAVRQILKCDVDGRTFAYVLQLIIILDDPENNRRGYAGEFGLRYYDNDGDGKFESLEPGDPLVNVNFRIPAWALQKER
jgi:hypothetical protein